MTRESIPDIGNIVKVEIGDSVTGMDDDEIFRNCTNLRSVTFGSGITDIPGYTFSECISLSGIVIPEGGSSLGNYAF